MEVLFTLSVILLILLFVYMYSCFWLNSANEIIAKFNDSHEYVINMQIQFKLIMSVKVSIEVTFRRLLSSEGTGWPKRSGESSSPRAGYLIPSPSPMASSPNGTDISMGSFSAVQKKS